LVGRPLRTRLRASPRASEESCVDDVRVAAAARRDRRRRHRRVWPTGVFLSGGRAQSPPAPYRIDLARRLEKSCDVTVVEKCSHYHNPIPSVRAVVDEATAWRQFVPYDASLKRGAVVRNEATGMLLTDKTRPKVLLADGDCLEADAVVVAIGASYAFPADTSTAPVADQLAAFKGCREALASAKGVCVVGGGVVGVELAAEVKARHPTCAVTIVHSRADLLSNWGPDDATRAKVTRAVRAKLAALGVACVFDDKVPASRFPEDYRGLPGIPVAGGSLETAKGAKIEADVAFWCAGNAFDGRKVFDMLASDARGKLKVDAYLRCESQDRVFAVGEIAAVGPGEYGLAGLQPMVVACAANVQAVLNGKAPTKKFKLPSFLPGVMTVGPRAGVAKLPFGTFTGNNFLANLKNTLGMFVSKSWADIGGTKMPKACPY